jgi:hypothetical protein
MDSMCKIERALRARLFSRNPNLFAKCPKWIVAVGRGGPSTSEQPIREEGTGPGYYSCEQFMKLRRVDICESVGRFLYGA